MPIEFKKDRNTIENDLLTISQEYGFSRTDRFISGLITPIVDAIDENFSSVYDLEKQSRIDTATDEWLASWARIHGQKVDIIEGGQDLSFDNVYIGTSDGRAVSDFTVNGEPLFLASGLKITDSSGRELLTTLDNILISGERAFTRVSIPSGFNISVSPGTYSLNVDFKDFAIRGLTDVPTLVGVVQRPISGVTLSLTDDDLRSIIFDRANSRNKANDAAIRTTLQFSEVAKVISKNFNSGSSSVSIYIEPRIGLLSQPLAARIRSYLEDLLPAGTRINIGPMVGSLLELKVRIKLPENFNTSTLDDIKGQVKSSIVSLIGQTNSGSVVNLDSIASTTASTVGLPAINIIDSRVNGKKIALASYSCRDIEFLYTDELRVEVIT
jgi:hypothetical protein